jgi:hypothetical protein
LLEARGEDDDDGVERELRGALTELRTVQLAKGVYTVKPRLAVSIKFLGRQR